MVEISQKNFNMDMSTYIAQRRKVEPVKKQKKKEKLEKIEEVEEELPEKNKSFFDKIMLAFLGEGTAPEEENNESGIFTKIKSWFEIKDGVEEELQEVDEPLVDDEIRDVLKIQNKWLLKLPKKTIEEFKKSEDYKKYKETLRKYNLIKN